jgi:hypothetical protein
MASLTADAIQPFLLTNLTRVEGRPSGTAVSALFSPGQRFGFDLDFDNAQCIVKVDFRDPAITLDAIASDCSRFSSAAFQTIAAVPHSLLETETLSWGLIKSYYAAFYAGHALMRMFGESYSYLDRSQCNHISSLATAIGNNPTFQVQAGPYRCSITPAVSAVDCVRLGGNSGGAHEVFGAAFGAKMKKVREGILTGPLAATDAQVVFAKLSEHARQCCSLPAPMHGWLSLVRNDLQYRHGFGAWKPTTVKRQVRERLSRLSEQWMREPMAVDLASVGETPLVQFVCACVFLVSLCIDALRHIAERSVVRSRSFATIGPLALVS